MVIHKARNKESEDPNYKITSVETEKGSNRFTISVQGEGNDRRIYASAETGAAFSQISMRVDATDFCAALKALVEAIESELRDTYSLSPAKEEQQ